MNPKRQPDDDDDDEEEMGDCLKLGGIGGLVNKLRFTKARSWCNCNLRLKLQVTNHDLKVSVLRLCYILQSVSNSKSLDS